MRKPHAGDGAKSSVEKCRLYLPCDARDLDYLPLMSKRRFVPFVRFSHKRDRPQIPKARKIWYNKRDYYIGGGL